MKQKKLYILWDEAHIWGLIAWRAMVAMGIPYQLIKGKDIAHGALSGKSPCLLLVPGGSARLKAHSLGALGREAISRYVAEGGHYFGICGGAGLGLSDSDGLGLCPWNRAAYTDRLQHLVSGHVLAACAPHPLAPETGQDLPLPVWWPGRFDPQPNSSVTVLATYGGPAEDLWVADLPLSSLPDNVFGEWQALYGINMQPDFLRGQPCVVHGLHGAGTYTLSYSHLETPHSLAANTWLAHLLHTLAGFEPQTTSTPPWPVEQQSPVWPHNDDTRPLWEARKGVHDLLALGLTHNLLFRRTEWLWGWRTGIPGAALNNLYAALCTALALPPTPAAMAYWYQQREGFCRALDTFIPGTEGYLLAERLATTLNASLPDAVDRHGLKEQRSALFGPPMSGGGVYKELLTVADELIFLLG
ncbi:MAG: biotin--protein ligase [Desulfovibrionaceae bacterium]